MGFSERLKKTAQDMIHIINPKKRNTVNVLFCGGRRVGKTSIMAAMEANMLERFPAGTITLHVPNAGKLAASRADQESRFMEGNDGNMTFYADEMESATDSTNHYSCQVGLDGQDGLSLNFIDVPGEWFVQPESEAELMALMKSAQILVVAVDSPHLVEAKEPDASFGRYHEVFNRAPELTRFIEKTLQGDNSPRLILFVPVKCELYRNNSLQGEGEDMRYLLEQVKAGYSELIQACKNNGNCAIVCAPCFTMGGMEFLQFVPRRVDFDYAGNKNSGELETDEYGQPLAEIMTDDDGVAQMTWLSEYKYLYDGSGRRYYRPENCDQPLNYILLFLFGIGRKRNEKTMSWLINKLFDLPDQKVLDHCKTLVKPKLKTEANEGYEVISDPYDMF